MRTFFLLSFGFLFSAVAWAGDAVNVRMAVVLAKEKHAEGVAPPEAFLSEHKQGRRKHKEARRNPCEERNMCKEEEGNQLESEELRPMRKALGLRRHYGWLKRFSKKRVTIDAKGEVIDLPGGGKASIRLQELKKDVATLVVSLPNTETVYQLGRTGSLYLQAGKYEDKEVWVVISPAKQFRSD